MIEGLYHVGFCARDFEAALAFFGETLGMEKRPFAVSSQALVDASRVAGLEEPMVAFKGAFVSGREDGTTPIDVYAVPGRQVDEGAAAANAASMPKLTLLVDDVRAACTRVQDAGYAVVVHPRRAGFPWLDSSDVAVCAGPSGVWIELVAPAGASGQGVALRLYAVTIICADLDAALAFRRDLLGMIVEKVFRLDRPADLFPGISSAAGGRGVVLAGKADDHRAARIVLLERTQRSPAPPLQSASQRFCAPGIARIAYVVADIARAYATLHGAGVHFMTAPEKRNNAAFGRYSLAMFADDEAQLHELIEAGP